jgi:hypothetical protein
MSGYILNVALGGRRAFRQDQCPKVTRPTDLALKWFHGLWHDGNLRFQN